MNAERELVHLFWSCGWASVRIAGSGSMKYPSADVLATDKSRILAIECKVTKKDRQYFSKEAVKFLKEFACLFGAEPWIAVKFGRRGWFFVKIGDLNESGKHFYISDKRAKDIGSSFEDLTKDI